MPVSYAVSSGTLPPGLLLEADGRLTGTPTQAGSFRYTIQAIHNGQNATNSVTATVLAAGKLIAMPNVFVPFGLCMSWDGRDGRATWSIDPATQIALCQKAGYSGMGLAQQGATTLKAFADHANVQSGKFRIHSMLWWATATQTVDIGWLDGILTQAARMNMALWVVAAGNHDTAGADAAFAFFQTVAAECRKYNVQLVLYPHAGTTFVSAEEALVLYNRLKTAGYPEVRLSIHLCHEQAAGNRNRLPEVIAKTASLAVLVTVNGSNGSGEIKPLDQGTFDPRGFLQALVDNHYAGPVELHTYAWADPRVDDGLARSLTRWHQLVSP
jgi:sugar phosphate isomerase/epimerase